MRSGQCPKCKSQDIVYIPGKIGGLAKDGFYTGLTKLSIVATDRLLCGDCGYLEEYILDEKDLQRVKDRFGRLR